MEWIRRLYNSVVGDVIMPESNVIQGPRDGDYVPPPDDGVMTFIYRTEDAIHRYDWGAGYWWYTGWMTEMEELEDDSSSCE